ncbi:PREDICTED: retrovirus-related Pol polyprotein from transposon 17.6 [Dipodomys ordii]|uniref:Retrovirus-related Pol polyprotein from transposon 17.6 n=1 Tax=Dipodomys ordii TaxID=10020 RepID=A0A1S3FEH4_DIPOR|nr:PREDICTED: retrovirus-related Pol polyprotein from transposon 17.6 [Dipodomys ordii]
MTEPRVCFYVADTSWYHPLLGAGPQGCILHNPPASRLPRFLCFYLGGPRHFKGTTADLDGPPSRVPRQPPFLWTGFSKGSPLSSERRITLDRKAYIESLSVPQTKEDILSFLGLAGFLCIWIPGFATLAKPLYEASKGSLLEPPDPTKPIDTPFKVLKQALLRAPALALPNLKEPFILYVTEKWGIGLGVLGQMSGPSFRPVAYLSKQLDPTVKGWPACLRALAAATTLAQESTKLTFGQPTTIHSPHRREGPFVS